MSRHAFRLLLSCVLAGAVFGCTIEKPEKPAFETDFHLPMGTQKTTGLDLYEDSEYIGGDSTGAGPLAFVLEGEIEEVQVGSALDARSPASSFVAALDEIEISAPASSRVEFPIGSLNGAPSADPEGEVVEPFSFEGLPLSVPRVNAFEWIRLRAGVVRVRILNNMPVALGAPGEIALRANLRDAAEGRVLETAEVQGEIAPRGEAELEFDLAGQSLHNELQFEVRGMSPGSEGLPVPVQVTDGITLDITLENLEPDSVVAEIPPQTLRFSRTVTLAEDLRIQEATIQDGLFTLSLRNDFALSATAVFRFPDLYRGDQPFPPQYVFLPAAHGSAERVEMTIDLQGADLSAPQGEFLTELRYEVEVTTEAVRQSVPIGLRQTASGSFEPATVRFARVAGILDRRRVEVKETETDFDPPEGIEDLEFQNASLTLEVLSTIGFGADVGLRVEGMSEEGGEPVTVPLDFAMAAGTPENPSETSVVVDEANSAILDLIRARPERLRISGEVLVGGSGGVGEIRRTDRVWGRYRVLAPLRVRLGSIEHESDPFRMTLDDEDQDRIRDYLVSGTASGTVENHFPVGLVARLAFAATEEDLEGNPAVVLDSILVLPAPVDAEGRVVRSLSTPFEVLLDPEEIQFFARPLVFGRVLLRVTGPDPDRVVLITALDYVDVRGMIHLRARVSP